MADPPARAYRLLVFDWDGTLLDSVSSIVECTRAALRDAGQPEPADAAIRDTIGLTLNETVGRLCPGAGEDLQLRVRERYKAHWYSSYRDQSELFAGVGRMLRGLETGGYLLAVATGKSRRGLDHGLDRAGLRTLFHATRTADDAPSKPHPGMLLDLLLELGVRAAEALMIGDSTLDLLMAAGAGTPAVAVASGAHRREQLAALAPLACLGSVIELPSWLEGEPGDGDRPGRQGVSG